MVNGAMKNRPPPIPVRGVHAAAPRITPQGKWLIAIVLSLPFAFLALAEWLIL